MSRPADFVSSNFATAKAWSILIVAVGHFLPDTPMWVLAQLALFVFAFASAFFTSTRYPEVQSIGSFWHKKIVRLGIPLLVINTFLLLVFLAKGTPGIVSLHTPLALVGLSGLYDWLGVRNQSPFGYGLWFLTLLLLFYSAYPWLSKAFHRRPETTLACFGALCVGGMHWAPLPYALWPTLFGFAYGLYASSNCLARHTDLPVLRMTAALLIILLGLNLGGIKWTTPYLLTALSVLLVHFLLQRPLPGFLHRWSAPFQACVLEIYVIHAHLFLPIPSLGKVPALLGSLGLILLCATSLHHLSELIERRFARPSITHKSISS